jgi:hypothetical protein
MNTVNPRHTATTCLVEIVELKWLLTGHGVHLHVERLQTDPEYARRTLDRADALPNAALQRAALRLRHRLGLAA